MSIELYRQDLMTELTVVKNAFAQPWLEIETDNNVIADPSKDHPHLCSEILYNGAAQMDLSNNPMHRYIGYWILTAKCKGGSGTAEANNLLEFFYPRLHKRKIGHVILEMASIVPPPKKGTGWWGISAMIPMRVDRVYS